MSSKSRIIAVVQRGRYKDSVLDIEIGKRSEHWKINMNGKPIKNVTGVWIKCLAGGITKVTLELVKDE